MAAKPEWCAGESEIGLSDGVRLVIRPVHEADSRLLRANFSKATAEDIHQRFFEYLKLLPDTLVDRLTHFDPCRELALVAVPRAGEGEPDDAYGVVRLAADSDCCAAEYAIIVRHDWQGRGLGWALTEAVLSAARRKGLKTVFALVLCDNERMIRMLREFGFVFQDSTDEGGVLRAELAL